MKPQLIPVINLRSGMTTYKEGTGGRLIEDEKLSKLFDLSIPLAFFTTSGKVVIWRPCGKVYVTW